ncbi:recombinase family protein [Streptomyces sp. NPDC002926]
MHVRPADPVGRLLFNMLGVVAEFGADLIRMRTREVMARPSRSSATGQLHRRLTCRRRAPGWPLRGRAPRAPRSPRRPACPCVTPPRCGDGHATQSCI